MLDKLMKYYKEAAWIFTVVAIAVSFYSWKASAEEAKKKVVQFEETFQNIAQIAQRLEDPNTWLRNYLLNHGEDSTDVANWVVYARKVPTDTAGNPRNNVIFYDSVVFPETGLIKMYIAGKETILDTLWRYPKKSM